MSANIKEYTTIGGFAEVETVIERSRFISAATHVDSAEQALEFVAQRKKQFFDATHTCYAFIAGDKAKFSDDGEPQGTAGMPIYECIKSSGLDHVCVAVTRYFGGIKLGAGGLVRAYSGGAASVLSQCAKVRMSDCTVAEVTADYTFLKPLRNALMAHAAEIDVVYDTQVRIVLLFLSKSSNTISDIVSQITCGKGIFAVKERLTAEFPPTKGARNG